MVRKYQTFIDKRTLHIKLCYPSLYRNQWQLYTTAVNLLMKTNITIQTWYILPFNQSNNLDILMYVGNQLKEQQFTRVFSLLGFWHQVLQSVFHIVHMNAILSDQNINTLYIMLSSCPIRIAIRTLLTMTQHVSVFFEVVCSVTVSITET